MAKVRKINIPMPARMPAPAKAAKTPSKTARPPSKLPVVGRAPKG